MDYGYFSLKIKVVTAVTAVTHLYKENWFVIFTHKISQEYLLVLGDRGERRFIHKKMRSSLLARKDKRGIGLVGGLVAGTGALVVTVIVGFVIIQTMLDAGILTAAGASDVSANSMAKNLSVGLDEVSEKIPTIFLIAAVVILFGAIVVLVQRSRQMTGGGTL